jgi:hypothetical protein
MTTQRTLTLTDATAKIIVKALHSHRAALVSEGGAARKELEALQSLENYLRAWWPELFAGVTYPTYSE